jgi:RimJ/RimL family protein N-acetyltransferase
MDHTFNELGQPIGFPLPGWAPPPRPARTPLEGRYCRLEPLDPERHGAALFAANRLDTSHATYTYLPYGPFTELDDYLAWARRAAQSEDPLFFAIVDAASDQPTGIASYLRITPAGGCIEVGHLHFSPRLQRTAASTEAMYRMMARAFELGYRRYEWKCDALNAPSRAAALRLGFTFEGIFRQATVYKGRSRDTAWFSIIDREWPSLDAAYRQWLDPANFDGQGRQRARLSDLIAASRA